MRKQLCISKNELNQPLQINIKNIYHVKPKGGFWTSSLKLDGTSEWIKWCKAEDELERLKGKYYVLIPKKSARIHDVYDYRSLKYLFQNYRWSPKDQKYTEIIRCLDWEKISKDFDAVHVTKEGEIIARGNSTYTMQNQHHLVYHNTF